MWRAIHLGLVVAIAGCAEEETRPVRVPASNHQDELRPASRVDLVGEAPRSAPDEVGIATWYGKAFAGRRTANGERFDPEAMTAAHRKLAFGTWVEVRRVDTGRRVRVRITDRGPWGDARRIVDVSRAAADVIGLTRDGTAQVELRVVRGPE